MVINRASKSNGKYKMWMNKHWFQRRSDMLLILIKLNGNKRRNLLCGHKTSVATLCKDETRNLTINDVFEVVEHIGQDYVESHWIITEKQGNNVKVKADAHLVAKAFQEENSNVRTNSPICSKENLPLLLAVSAPNKYETHSLDIKSAFLQGRQIEREVFVKSLKETAQGVLWRLKKEYMA